MEGLSKDILSFFKNIQLLLDNSFKASSSSSFTFPCSSSSSSSSFTFPCSSSSSSSSFYSLAFRIFTSLLCYFILPSLFIVLGFRIFYSSLLFSAPTKSKLRADATTSLESNSLIRKPRTAMPKSYTSSQRTAIQQFTAFTNASDRTAAKWLKQNSWNVEVAADSFFHSNGRSGGSGSTHSSGNVSRSAITKVFDQYRESSDPPDQMTINGVMGYFQAIDINLEDPVLIAICEKLQSPTMGEFSRNGFVDGWVNLGCDTVAKMKDKVPELRQSMANDPAYFKSVYLWTFNWARSEGQKSLPLENAIEWWRLLLQNRFSGHLDHWITFLTEKWNKSVPKDTWNMLYDFVEFAEKDPSLASYDEMGAWPSVIDGYVEYYRDMNK